jgi:hypothetical protein
MTLVEFLFPLKKTGTRTLCLGVMYYNQRYQNINSMTVESLRINLKRARVPKVEKINLADVLSKSAPFVDTVGKDGTRFLWALTDAGNEEVRTALNLPAHDIEIETDVSSLDSLVAKLSDADVKDYLNESIRCLRVHALRASVVFLWSGAVKKIRDDIFTVSAPQVTVAIQKFDPKAKEIKKIDDLVLIKESVLLLAAQELGIFDKNQKNVLEDCLNLRNKCGHPGKYKVGPKKVSSFIEDLIGVVFA